MISTNYRNCDNGKKTMSTFNRRAGSVVDGSLKRKMEWSLNAGGGKLSGT